MISSLRALTPPTSSESVLSSSDRACSDSFMTMSRDGRDGSEGRGIPLLLLPPLDGSLSDEERMKVAETDVISRTKRARRGDHGLMECHSD